MAEQKLAWHGLAGAAAALAIAALLAGCGSEPPDAAPVIMKGAELTAPAPAPAAPVARRIIVRSGQSVRGIAYANHVPASAIIAANRLRPPYKIEAGQRLLIPAGGAPPIEHARAAPPSVSPPSSAPLAAAHPPPEIIPLDGPAPPGAARSPQSAGASPAPVPDKAKSEPGSAAKAHAEAAVAAHGGSGGDGAPLPHGGHFPWPVHGRVLAGYGVAPGGAHNDGINIAAPKGAPITAVDGGVVAYAGNELRGYGNLVLVKHPNGWISAYAHCEELLVKRGDKVRSGQVIAKVGATGGVSEPQLHFELRRGQRPVDPREFLAPAPSAEAGAAVRRG